MIHVTLNQRSQQVKLAIYKTIAARLARNPGMRPEDVLISPVGVAPELVVRRWQGAVREG